MHASHVIFLVDKFKRCYNFRMKTSKCKETDLYEPIRRMLAAQGFIVKGEVKHCDIAAVRDELLWVVEMKLQLNITLLYQAMERLQITDQVFVAIPRPRKANDKNFRMARRILAKLELGLITVALDSPVPMAEIVLFPGGKPVKSNKSSESVKREIKGRLGDTEGGGNKIIVNTAYRERCLRIACALDHNGPMNAPRLIKEFHCGPDTYNIMRLNHYGWFEKINKGVFSLTEKGKSYLTEHDDSAVVAYYRMRAEEGG